MIRLMTPKDISSVMRIERESFSDPWTMGNFIDDLFSPIPYLIVEEEEGKILGYADCWMMYDEAHIANIAVDKNMRHKGIGRKILEHLLEKAKEKGLEKAMLECRVSNENAIRLYESLGFEVIYRHPEYYTDTDEDAFIMIKYI